MILTLFRKRIGIMIFTSKNINEYTKLELENPELYNKITEVLNRYLIEYSDIRNNTGTKIIKYSKDGKPITNTGNLLKKYRRIVYSLLRHGTHSPQELKIFRERTRKTNIERYGVENVMHLSETKQKIRKTNLERYGVENFLSLPKTRDKIRKTNIGRYGVENVGASEQTKKKIKQTNLKKYGTEYQIASEQTKKKIKQTFNLNYNNLHPKQVQQTNDKFVSTMLNRYGVENPNQLEWVRNKIRKTNIKKFGVEIASQSNKVKLKARKTNLERYGVEYHTQNKKIRRKIIKSNQNSSLESRLVDILEKNNIIFTQQYLIYNDNISHTYDFAIFNNKSELVCLVNCDGIYWHAYKSDPDGRRKNKHYDIIRLSLIPNDIKYIQIIENSFDKGVEELLSILDLDYNEYSNDMFNYFRNNDFPYSKYIDSILQHTFGNIFKYKIKHYNSKHRYGDKIIKHFHKSLFHKPTNNSLSVYDAFHNDTLLKKCIDNGFMYKDFTDPSRVLNGFTYSNIAPIHKPFTASLSKYLITKYLSNHSTIFDPHSGFSGRMLGAVGAGKSYIGYNDNKELIKESNTIIKYFNINNATITQPNQYNTNYNCLFTSVSSDKEIDNYLQKYSSNTYLFIIPETKKYKQYIVEELIDKQHYVINTNLVIKISR